MCVSDFVDFCSRSCLAVCALTLPRPPFSRSLSTTQVGAIETEIACGQVEQLIQQAEGELELIPQYASWKAWESPQPASNDEYFEDVYKELERRASLRPARWRPGSAAPLERALPAAPLRPPPPLHTRARARTHTHTHTHTSCARAAVDGQIDAHTGVEQLAERKQIREAAEAKKAAALK